MGSNNKSIQIAEYLGTIILSAFPTVESLAALHHISVSKLMRDFKRTFQTSPYLYFRRLQMTFAEEYMRNTGCSKKEMAFMLGFSNPANYTLCYNRFLRDKTKEGNQEIARDELNEKNHILVSQLPFPVAMFDKNMNYLLASKQLLSICGLVGSSLVGGYFFDLFPGKDADQEHLKKQMLEGKLTAMTGDYDFYINGNLLRSKVNSWYDDVGEIGGLIIFLTSY